MMNNAYHQGRAAAFAHYKLGNAIKGYGANTASPQLSGQAATGAPPPSTATPPTPPAAPIAAGAAKASVLG